MKYVVGMAALLVCGASFLPAQHKKKDHTDLSALFQNARYVYVQAEDGDVTDPRLFQTDRQAIADVEDGIRAWNRYSLTINRSEADLIIFVRKGRLAGVQGHGGISDGPHPMSPSYPGQGSPQNQRPDDDEVGARAEIGPVDDMMTVYASNADGKRIGPIWKGEQADGLDAPNVLLLRQLRSAVERAYPTPPPQQSKPNPPSSPPSAPAP